MNICPFFGFGLFRSSARSYRQATPEQQAKHLLARLDRDGAIKAANAVKKNATKPSTIKFWSETIQHLSVSR
jgi:hypothetical protein